MKGGNLSNTPAIGVIVRFEEVLKVDGKLNVKAVRMLEEFNVRSLNLYIITTGDKRKAMAFCYKYGIPYTSVFSVDTLYEIREICRGYNPGLYIDNDRDILESVDAVGVQTKPFTEVEF